MTRCPIYWDRGSLNLVTVIGT